MSEPEANEGSGFAALQDTRRRISRGTKRRLIIVGALVIGWVILAQILPRAFPPPTLRKPAPAAATPAPAPEPAPALAEAPPAPEPAPETEQPSAEDAPMEPPPPSLSEAPPPPPAPAADVEALESRIGQLEQASQSNASQESVRLLDAQLRAQAEEIAQLKIQQLGAERRIALLAAYDRLKDRALTGQPFVAQLSDMQQRAGGDELLTQTLEPLGAYAELGVPTLETLAEEFTAAIPGALHPESGEESFGETLARYVSPLITVRKVGALTGNSPEAVLARAEEALQQGKVETALAGLEALPESSAAALAAFRAHAQAHVALRRALPAIREAILAP